MTAHDITRLIALLRFSFYCRREIDAIYCERTKSASGFCSDIHYGSNPNETPQEYRQRLIRGKICYMFDEKTRLILASGSPRRKELLEHLGMDFEVIVSGCDETTGSLAPAETVKELSKRKCLASARRIPDDAIVIGADTIVVFNGIIYGKPDSKTDAFEMLKSLQGRIHEVYTGVTVASVKSGNIVYTDSFAEKTAVHVAKMTEEEIMQYIDSGEPSDKAGAYGIQGLFSKFITGIEGDYFNVVGLPLAALYSHLKLLREHMI